MNKIWFIIALVCAVLGTMSCSNDDKDEDEIENANIVGTWVALSGNYNLS